MPLPLLIFLWVIAGLIVLLILIYIINETNIFYSEPKEYSEPDLSKIMDEKAAPLYLIDKNDRAIMFVHGFTGNPQQLRYFSEKANKDGFDVITPLQPGAGTTTEDFKNSYFSQWYNCIRDNYLKYRRNYKQFYIVGHSMGSAITLKLTEEFNNDEELKPTAVLPLSAPVFHNNFIELNFIYNPLLYFTRMISWIVKEQPERFVKPMVDGNDRIISYDGTFPAQIHSLKMGLKPIRKNLKKITVPVFLAHTKKDKVVPFENLYYIAKRLSSDIIKIKVYDLGDIAHTHHNIPVYDSTRDDLYREIMFFIEQLNA